MAGHNVLVTGATGFIGSRLVKQLVSRGDNVKCLVRQTSNITQLENLSCSLVFGDTVTSPDSLVDAAANVDRVYHVAASTHAVHSRDLVGVNTAGFTNLLKACGSRTSPPEVVFVSSLAAVGPSQGSRLHVETDVRKPVSYYGRSKADCEVVAIEHANRMPISIVRPPIVLGEGDRHGLELFRLIDQWGWHLVPGFSNRLFSVIHVDDLVTALITVGDCGKRLSSGSDAQGIYFASNYETLTYAGLGKLVGKAIGRKRTRVLRVAKPCMWAFAAFNEIRARIEGSPQYVNLDKFREAFAGSWACSSTKLLTETGFALTTTLLSRLEQTADWYRSHGWLKEVSRQDPLKPKTRPTRQTVEHVR